MPTRASVTILVRNYNGQELLAGLLPGLIQVVRSRGEQDEILVVDDGSTDDSVQYVRSAFPDVRLERIQPNSGNSIVPVNVGVQASKHEIVFCLDNDVLVDSDFISPVVTHFDNPEVFAVCPKIVNPNHNGTIESVNYPSFRRGRLVGIVPGKNFPCKLPVHPVSIWYTPGNGSAYRKNYYTRLGGLDTLYRPIYFEDVDICYRAWRRGWQSLYEPGAVTQHLKHVTTRKQHQKNERIEIFRVKNQLLFTWKNLLDSKLFFSHLLWTTARLSAACFRNDPVFPAAFRKALSQIREVLTKRLTERREAVIDDREIFSRIHASQNNPLSLA
jgi:GT2 family glycosyltransferase